MHTSSRVWILALCMLSVFSILGCEKKSVEEARIRDLETRIKQLERRDVEIHETIPLAKIVEVDAKANTTRASLESTGTVNPNNRVQPNEVTVEKARDKETATQNLKKAMSELEAHFSEGIPINTYLVAGKAAAALLQRLSSKTSVGINYTQYGNSLVELKPDFDAAMSQIPKAFQTNLTNAMEAHVCALEFWAESIRRELSNIPYTRLSRYRSRGLPEPVKYYEVLYVKHFWSYAQSEVDAVVAGIRRREEQGY